MLGVPEGWTTDFATWLRQRQGIHDNYIPHMIRWVERFIRLANKRPGERWQDALLVFLEDLGNGETPDWQIRQADDAVRLFFGPFLGSRASATQIPSPGAAQPAHRDTSRPARIPLSGEPAASVPPSTADGVMFEPHKALEEMRRLLRLRHYAERTVRAYLAWARRYLMFIGKQGPMSPTTGDAQAYLSHLAIRGGVSASTQNQALNAILFLHRHVFQAVLGDMTSTLRAKRGEKLPIVLTVDEVRAIFAQLVGKHRMMLELVYGTGMRLSEMIQLRVKDIDFGGASITIRSGKGDKDRVTMLPRRLIAPLKHHLEDVRALHEKDLAASAGEAPLPDALKRKYPNAGREWGWQYVFPSA